MVDMNVRQIKPLTLALALFLLAAAALEAQEVHRFRGNGADSFYNDPAFNPTALKKGARIVWQAAVGQGYSGVSLKGGRVYTMGNNRKEDTVYCLNSITGKIVWKYSYPCGTNEHPGPRATPALDGGLVYTLSLEGHLFALRSDNGKVVWKKNLAKDFGARLPSWALAGSPVIDGNVLYVNANRHGIALNKATGKKIWASPSAVSGYATPVLFTVGRKRYGAFFGHSSIYGVDLATGRAMWEKSWPTGADVNAADPLVFGGNKLFISSGYGKGCALFQFAEKSLKELWRNESLAAHFSSPVHLDGHIYGITDNSGSGGRFQVLDAATGETTLSERVKFGNFIVVNKKYFFIAFERGELAVAEITPDAYTLRSSASLKPNIYWTAPVVSGGRAFIRNERGDLFCVNMK